jgi:hypothetical protein
MKNRLHLIPTVISALMLFLALADWPYGYYQLLRLVVCGSASYVAYLGYQSDKQWILWVFAAIAVLFNPIVRIHLNREIWAVIDVICAIFFVFITVLYRTKNIHEG